MGDFIETLKLAEKAQEDIYFAKIDRELIEALHRRLAGEAAARAANGPAEKKSGRAADRKVSGAA